MSSSIGRRHRRGVGLALLAVLSAGAILPVAVFADGDAPKLEVDPPRVAAGGAVTVHGIDLADPGAVSIELIDAAGAAVPLGIATADHDGTFWFVVAVPTTAPPGSFVVRAVDAGGAVIEVPLAVGPAALEGGEQRGADEPLLAPMGSTGPVPATQPLPGSSLVAPGPAADARILAVVLGLVIVVASVLAGLVRIRTRRSGRAPTGTQDMP